MCQTRGKKRKEEKETGRHERRERDGGGGSEAEGRDHAEVRDRGRRSIQTDGRKAEWYRGEWERQDVKTNRGRERKQQ